MQLTGASVPRLAFVFGARDVLWKGIGIRRSLADGGPIDAALARCARVIRDRLGWSLDETLSTGAERIPVERMAPALVSVQIALTDAWRARGIVPYAIGARSGGEFASHYAWGAVTASDALEAPFRWSRLVQEKGGAATMLVLRTGLRRAIELSEASPAQFFVVSDADDANTVIACEQRLVAKVGAYLSAQGVGHSATHVNFGPHSPLIDGWKSGILEPPIAARPGDPDIAYYSAGAAQAVDPALPYDARLWQALRAPALVGRMFRRMMDDGCSAFVEIGGRLTMGETIIRQAGAEKRVVALPSMQRGEPAGAVMEQTHARLRELGVPGA